MRPRFVACGVVTTKGRPQYLDRTLKSLVRAGFQPRVFCDLMPGLIANHQAALAELFSENNDEYALLIQDDVLACGNAAETVELFLTKFYGEPMFSFFDWRKDRTGVSERIGYRLDPQPVGELACMYHRSFYHGARVAMEANRAHPLYAAGHHDGMVSLYCVHQDVCSIRSAPTLFQHIGMESTHSTRGQEIEAGAWRGEEWDSLAHFKELWGV